MKKLSFTLFNAKRNFIILLLCTLSIPIASLAQIPENEIIEVQGITKALLKRVITYGDFSTSKVKAVQVTHGFDVDGMGMEFTNKKYSFTQISPAGEAEITASDNPDKEQINTIKQLFGINTKGKVSYSGKIKGNSTEIGEWHFYVNPAKSSSEIECGKIISEGKEGFIISGQNSTTSKQAMFGKMTFKYSFSYNGEIVAMVNTDGTADYGTCKIWIKKDLDKNLQLIVASVCSSLLARIGN